MGPTDINKSLHGQINGSNQRMLGRIGRSCAARANGSIPNIIMCIFGQNITSCNSNNVTYYNPNGLLILDPSGVSTWQGICSYNDKILMCGTTLPSPTTGTGLIYIGNIQCNDPNGQYIKFLVPGSKYTSCYGPRYYSNTDSCSLVGSYNNPGDTNTYGFLFVGGLNELDISSNYVYKMQPVVDEYPITFVHSTYGNFAVGASGTISAPSQLKAWIYNIDRKTYTEFKFQDASYNTIYGIVQNSENNYTIAGGYSNLDPDITTGFICDFVYNPVTHALTYSNQTSIQITSATHFEGISRTSDSNVYTLPANYITGGAGVLVRRNITNQTFDIISSQKIDYSCSMGRPGVTSSNSALGNNFIGYYVSGDTTSSWQCTIKF